MSEPAMESARITHPCVCFISECLLEPEVESARIASKPKIHPQVDVLGLVEEQAQPRPAGDLEIPDVEPPDLVCDVARADEPDPADFPEQVRAILHLAGQ